MLTCVGYEFRTKVYCPKLCLVVEKKYKQTEKISFEASPNSKLNGDFEIKWAW